MLEMYYKDRSGVCVPYQERDPRYDISQGYLQKEPEEGTRCKGGKWALARGSGTGLG